MTLIALGYIFIFFRLVINGFDLLSDVLGYIFLLIGLTRMIPESAQFARARRWAIPMSIIGTLVFARDLWILLFPQHYIATVSGLTPFVLYSSDIVLYILQLLVPILPFLVSRRIILGLRDMEKTLQTPLNTRIMNILWWIQLIAQVIISGTGTLFMFFLLSDTLANAFGLPAVVIALIAHGVFIGFLWNARTRYILALRAPAASEQMKEQSCVANGNDE